MTEQSAQSQHEFTIDVDNRLVIATIAGRVTLDSLLSLAARIYADGRAEPDFSTIIDFQTTELELTFADLHEYSERIGANPQMLRGKLVFVASTAVAYGIARMYQGTHDSFPSDIKFEPTVEAAMATLRSPDK